MPTAVHEEVVIRGLEHGYADAHTVALAIQRGWLVVSPVTDADIPPDISALALDRGEKQSLLLAQQASADLILVDDLIARSEASARGLPVKDTVGVIVSAFRSGLLALNEATTLLDAIVARDDIRISDELCRQVLDALQ